LLHLELHAAELNKVARRQSPHLPGKQALLVHKRAAWALKISD
jgi:hypothetical protein